MNMMPADAFTGSVITGIPSEMVATTEAKRSLVSLATMSTVD